MEEAIGAALATALVAGVFYLFKTLHNYNVSSIENKYKIRKKDEEVKIKYKGKIGWVEDEIYKVVEIGGAHTLFNLSGKRVGTLGVSKETRKKALEENKYIQGYINKSGKKIFRKKSLTMDFVTGKITKLLNQYTKDEQALHSLRLQLFPSF